SVSDSSAHVSPHQPRKPACARPQRRRHDLDPVERVQLGNEAGLMSVQAGRGPPYRFRFNIVRDNSFAPLNNIKWRISEAMMNYRTITLAVVGLFLSVSFLASPVMAVEKDGVMMRDGKMWRLQDGKEIGRMDRETTMTNGTRVMMSGKMVMKDGKEMQMQEGQTMMLDGKMMEGVKSTGK